MTSIDIAKPRSELLGIVDRLNVIRYLNGAAHMAASDSGLTLDACNSMQALLSLIDDRLTEATEQLEKMIEVYSAIYAAVTAEQARRKGESA